MSFHENIDLGADAQRTREEPPPAAERLLTMRIKRPGHPEGVKVIKKIEALTAQDREVVEHVKEVIETIVEGVPEAMRPMVASQMGTIVNVLEAPFIYDIFETHKTDNTEKEEDWGRHEWRNIRLRTEDPEAFEYFQSNALRASNALNASLNAIAFLKAVAPPQNEEGAAVLTRFTEEAERMKKLSDDSAPEQGAVGPGGDVLAQVANAQRTTHGYNNFTEEQKRSFVLNVRQFLYLVLEEIAPYYEKKEA